MISRIHSRIYIEIGSCSWVYQSARIRGYSLSLLRSSSAFMVNQVMHEISKDRGAYSTGNIILRRTRLDREISSSLFKTEMENPEHLTPNKRINRVSNTCSNYESTFSSSEAILTATLLKKRRLVERNMWWYPVRSPILHSFPTLTS